MRRVFGLHFARIRRADPDDIYRGLWQVDAGVPRSSLVAGLGAALITMGVAMWGTSRIFALIVGFSAFATPLCAQDAAPVTKYDGAWAGQAGRNPCNTGGLDFKLVIQAGEVRGTGQSVNANYPVSGKVDVDGKLVGAKVGNWGLDGEIKGDELKVGYCGSGSGTLRRR